MYGVDSVPIQQQAARDKSRVDVARDKSRVDVAIDELGHVRSELDQVILELDSRLRPVLGPSPAAISEKNPTGPRAVQSNVAERVSEHTRDLYKIVECVRGIISRLEV